MPRASCSSTRWSTVTNRWGTMRPSTVCQKQHGTLCHIVSFETAWTWCGRATNKMDKQQRHPTCVACIARAIEWQAEWTNLRTYTDVE